jgi:hypothetical protein
MGKHNSSSSLDMLGPATSSDMRESSWVSRGSVDRQGSVDSSALADFLGNTFELHSEEFGSWNARVRTKLWDKYWRNERKNIQVSVRTNQGCDLFDPDATTKQSIRKVQLYAPEFNSFHRQRNRTGVVVIS